jgi:aerobic carbon-monoxide dehydrogenase small subunit
MSLRNKNGVETAVEVEFYLNGIAHKKAVPASWTLLRFLRDGLGYFGTKCGCEVGECGACTVLLNGEPVNACLVLAPQIDGSKIWTIEGIAASGANDLHPIQKAFIDCDAVHCGFCSPGMVMTTIALFIKNINPNDAEIKQSLAGNLCRCTGYIQILDAVRKAALIISQNDLQKFIS